MPLNLKRQPKRKPTGGRVMRKKAMRRARLMKVPDEVKFFDTALAFNFDQTAEVPGTGGQLALIPQGDTQSTRDGRLARIKSIHIKAVVMVAGPSVAGDGGSGFELYVVQDKQANGAAAAVADVLTITGTSNITGAFRNLNNSKRFRVLKRIVWYPGENGIVNWLAEQAAATFTATATQVHIDELIPCDIMMDWNGTTGAITEITQNNIFLIAGAAGNTGDDRPVLSGNARLRFVG